MEFLVLIFLITAGLMWAPAPHFFRILGERKLSNSARVNRTICLTFDDGPSEHLTQQLINLLGRYDALATFYLQGNKLDQSKTIESIVSKGHEIGCHGYSHVNAWYSAPTKTWKDMDRALREFEDNELYDAAMADNEGRRRVEVDDQPVVETDCGARRRKVRW